MYGVHGLPSGGNVPIPQGLKQIIGVAANTDLNTWRPIVSKALSGRTPDQQFTETTPEALKMVGAATGTSGAKLAWFLDQITGNVSSAILGTLDMVNPMLSGPARAEKRLDQIPFIKTLFQNPTSSAESEQAYERASRATSAHQTLGDMRRSGASAAELQAYLAAHKADIVAQPLAGQFIERMGAFNTAMRQIQNADMPVATKTRRIRELEQMKNDYASKVSQAFERLEAMPTA